MKHKVELQEGQKLSIANYIPSPGANDKMWLYARENQSMLKLFNNIAFYFEK